MFVPTFPVFFHPFLLFSFLYFIEKKNIPKPKQNKKEKINREVKELNKNNRIQQTPPGNPKKKKNKSRKNKSKSKIS
jgi:hypothetical protein